MHIYIYIYMLKYCYIIHNSGKKLKCDKIDNIQSKCLGIIEFCHKKVNIKNEDVLNVEYNIESLQSKRNMQLACIMYIIDTVIMHSLLKKL